MCDPATIMTLASTGVSAFGEFSSASAESAALERDAQLAQQQADFELDALQEQQEQLRGQQRVAAAKSGATTSGSILETMRGSAEQAELEALNIEFGAEAGTQARLFEAAQTKQAGMFKAGTTLLTGANKSGVFN